MENRHRLNVRFLQAIKETSQLMEPITESLSDLFSEQNPIALEKIECAFYWLANQK